MLGPNTQHETPTLKPRPFPPTQRDTIASQIGTGPLTTFTVAIIPITLGSSWAIEATYCVLRHPAPRAIFKSTIRPTTYRRGYSYVSREPFLQTLSAVRQTSGGVGYAIRRKVSSRVLWVRRCIYPHATHKHSVYIITLEPCKPPESNILYAVAK